MALAQSYVDLVFEVFGIPQADSILWIDGAWTTGKTQLTGAITTSVDEILVLIAALTATQETRLIVLLDEWRAVSTTGIKLKPNVANEGVDRDPARERRLIKQRIFVMIPIVLAKEHNAGGGIPLG